MNWEIILAVLAGIITVSAFIKALPIIWEGLKNTYSFIFGLGKVSVLPEYVQLQGQIQSMLKEISNSLNCLGNELREHMIEEEKSFHEREHILKMIIRASLIQSSSVFRHITLTSEIAYFEVERQDDAPEGWRFIWINDACEDLVGLDLAEISTVGWPMFLDEKYRDMNVKLISGLAARGEEIDIDVTIVNQENFTKKRVKIIAYPLIGVEGNPDRYIGAMHLKKKSKE